MTPPQLAPVRWGPARCRLCRVGLPPGIVMLDRDTHVDCEEARRAWLDMEARGRTLEML